MRSSSVDLSLDVEEVGILPRSAGLFQINLVEVSKCDVLDYFSIADIVHHFNEDELLEYIGMDSVKKYFDLTEVEYEQED